MQSRSRNLNPYRSQCLFLGCFKSDKVSWSMMEGSEQEETGVWAPGNLGSLAMSAGRRWGAIRDPAFSAHSHLILSFLTLGLENMPRWFQAKPQIQSWWKRQYSFWIMFAKGWGWNIRGQERWKQWGDVIWSGGILHNRIFSYVGHCREWHFKRAQLKQKAIKCSGVIKLENALDKT